MKEGILLDSFHVKLTASREMILFKKITNQTEEKNVWVRVFNLKKNGN